MSESQDFDDALAEALDVIDRALARGGLSLPERPLQAARDFAEYCIVEINVKGEATKPGSLLDDAHSEWFKVLYARTIAWYRGRYGDAMERRASIAYGCVLILETPFGLEVPLVTRRPGTPGETIWVCFPGEVEPDEEALTWLVAGPKIAALPRGDALKGRRLATEVASALRAIHQGLGTVERTHPRVGALRDAIMPHLEKAARQIVRGSAEALRHAQWDLQMACELALKLLAEQRAGQFVETHDLNTLYDRLPPGPRPFPRTWLRNIPGWERMAQWRYGGGPLIATSEAFSRYRTALKIVRAVSDVAERKVRTAGACFQIRRAPFLHGDPAMFEPRDSERDPPR